MSGDVVTQEQYDQSKVPPPIKKYGFKGEDFSLTLEGKFTEGWVILSKEGYIRANWTRQTPTVPGYYFAREEESGNVMPVLVSAAFANDTLGVLAICMPLPVTLNYYSHWFGPIAEPEFEPVPATEDGK